MQVFRKKEFPRPRPRPPQAHRGAPQYHHTAGTSRRAWQYALEDFILFSEHPTEAHSKLTTFVVNPIFMRNARCARARARRGDATAEAAHDVHDL